MPLESSEIFRSEYSKGSLGTVVAPTGLGRDVSGSIEIQEFIGGDHRAARWWVDVGHREQREIP